MKIYSIFKKLSVTLFLIFPLLTSCQALKPKKVDAKNISNDPKERVKRNIEEGRGFRLMGGNTKGGVFEFASSNSLWKASLDTIEFMQLASANYSGGIIITDWYSESENNQSIKITIQFFSNEIRADGLDVLLHKKICDEKNQCSIKKIDNTLSYEIKETILKKAALMKEENETKDKKKGKKKTKDSKFKQQKIKTKGARK